MTDCVDCATPHTVMEAFPGAFLLTDKDEVLLNDTFHNKKPKIPTKSSTKSNTTTKQGSTSTNGFSGILPTSSTTLSSSDNHNILSSG